MRCFHSPGWASAPYHRTGHDSQKHMTGTGWKALPAGAEYRLSWDFEQCARFGIRSRSAMEIKQACPIFNENTEETNFKQDGISSDRVCQKDKGTGSASGKRPEYDAGNLDLPLEPRWRPLWTYPSGGQ